jgi:hypothetical protein
MPAMTKSGMFFTEARIVEAVWLFWICALLSRSEIVVNVPGNMINPARRIHLILQLVIKHCGKMLRI